jgi:hypothetical protein
MNEKNLLDAHLNYSMIEEIVKLLKPFEEITRDLSQKKSTLSAVLPAIKLLKISLDIHTENPLIQAIKKIY